MVKQLSDSELTKTYQDLMTSSETESFLSRDLLLNLLRFIQQRNHKEQILMAALMIKRLIYKNANAKLLFKNLYGTQVVLSVFQQNTTDMILQRILSRIIWILSSQDMLKQTLICNGLGIMTKIFEKSDKITQSNLIACFRNISSGGAHVRRRIRSMGCLQTLLFNILQYADTTTDATLIENSCCLLRNLSYRFAPESYLHYDDNDDSQNKNLFNSAIIPVYLKLLLKPINVTTIEAIIGSIQNLTSNSK